MTALDGLAVQVLHTTWTKKSRGAPSAASRNTAPVGLPLPVGWTTSAPVHLVRLDEGASSSTSVFRWPSDLTGFG